MAFSSYYHKIWFVEILSDPSQMKRDDKTAPEIVYVFNNTQGIIDEFTQRICIPNAFLISSWAITAEKLNWNNFTGPSGP